MSNSSSSSFVVFFTEQPKDREHLREMIYPDLSDDNIKSFYDYNFSIKQITSRVWSDIQGKNPNDKDEAIDTMDFYDDIDYPNENDYFEPLINVINWIKYDEECKKFKKQKFDELLKNRNINETYYIFEYSDNDGQFETFLEHGEIFYNLFHHRISHH